MENTKKVKLNKSEEKTIKSQLQVLETYIKEEKELTGTISENMAMAALIIVKNYIETVFFCNYFGIKPIDLNKKIIWGTQPELIPESNGMVGTKQTIYKTIEVPDEQVKQLTQSQLLIIETCEELKEMLLDKNRKYGDSALNPQRIFSRADTIEQINVRIDDKLSRLKSRQADEDEDVENDLLGYLILKKVAMKILQIKNSKEEVNENH